MVVVFIFILAIFLACFSILLIWAFMEKAKEREEAEKWRRALLDDYLREEKRAKHARLG